MSRRKSGEPVRNADPLDVPDVAPGDLGLVMAVHGFRHDITEGYWWLLGPENRLYRLPPELNDWAARLDADVTRKLISLPKVFAFSSIHDHVRVRVLSMA